MAWERRARGGQYYTRSRKVNGQVVREYVGCGPLAALAATLDEHSRTVRAAETEAGRREKARLREADALLDAFCAEVDTLARLALVGAGFRQHDRGAWRRRRAKED